MKKPQVWHYHYDNSGHARKHLHFGGRVRHEHVNLSGYGQFTSTLHNNEVDSGKRRVKYFGRSTPSRIDAETAMNPGAARHRQEAVSLYKEARTTDSERRKALLQVRAAEHVQSAIESDAEGIPNPGSEHIENRQTAVWDSATLTEILKQLRKLVDKSGKKGLIVTRDTSKGIAEVRGVRTGRLFLRAMQVHGGWIVRWDGKLITRKDNPNKKWHKQRLDILTELERKYPEDKILFGQKQEEIVALYHNPEIDIKCAFCGNGIRSIKTAKMVRGKIYHSECEKLLKKVQGVR